METKTNFRYTVKSTYILVINVLFQNYICKFEKIPIAIGSAYHPLYGIPPSALQ